MNPFDFVNDINYVKKNILTEDNEKDYDAYLTNRQLSFFPDTIFLANKMNEDWHLDNKLQFDFLINMVRKRKRFSKWDKPLQYENVELIKEYFGYSAREARAISPYLSEKHIDEMKKRVFKGGRK